MIFRKLAGGEGLAERSRVIFAGLVPAQVVPRWRLVSASAEHKNLRRDAGRCLMNLVLKLNRH